MDGKLDQSLDQIMKDRKSTTTRKGRGRRVGKAVAVVAPTGGVSKATKAVIKTAKANGKVVRPVVPITGTRGESKIVISGLPQDVNEKMIKEYTDAIAPPTRRVMLSYDANGRSRGVATVIFGKPQAAHLASQKMHGIKVDGRVIKVEVVVEAGQAPIPVSAKSLADRMGNNSKKATKDKPKSAAGAAGEAKKGAKPTKRGRNAGRPKPKSKEDLDAEMTDYFNDGNPGATAAATNGAVNSNPTAPAAAAGGDTGMEDEIM